MLNKKKEIIQNSISEREKSIMTFIHEFGFCEIEHIKKKFQLGRSTTYDIVKILRRLEMIKSKEVLPRYKQVYFLTSKAIQLINSNLPPIKQIASNTYLHHLAVINVHLQITRDIKNHKWLTERILMRVKYDADDQTKTHLPDGILITPAQKKIAVEVELSLKAQDRLFDIFTDYEINRDIHEVWYFCPAKILASLQNIKNTISTLAASDLSKIKFHLIEG